MGKEIKKKRKCAVLNSNKKNQFIFFRERNNEPEQVFKQ
jgi:hypothetical protein